MADLDLEKLWNLRVVDLKERLRARGLPVTGIKVDLIRRLREDMEQKQNRWSMFHGTRDAADVNLAAGYRMPNYCTNTKFKPNICPDPYHVNPYVPCVGELSTKPISTEEEEVTWDIADLLRKYWDEAKEMKSDTFSLAGATWNFFTSYNLRINHYQFGIDVQTQISSKAEFDCYCNISFLREDDHTVKSITFNFNCEKADVHWVVKNFLTNSEILNFVRKGQKIVCRISTKKSSNRRACANNVDKDIPKSDPVYKVCEDLKQLLLNEEDSDVTFQVGDQQFKAHQSILKARSSVFAAMFRHDMKEKATGVVNIEDCEPSCFPVFLEFLYSGSIEKLSVANVLSLYNCGDKYDLQDLKMKCIEFIENNLSVENFCDILEQLLILQHLEDNLLKLITDFLVRNFKRITITSKWQALKAENSIQVNEILIKALASVV